MGGGVRIVMDAAVPDVERDDKPAFAERFERIVNGRARERGNLRQKIVVDGAYGRVILFLEQIVENADALQGRTDIFLFEKFGRGHKRKRKGAFAPVFYLEKYLRRSPAKALPCRASSLHIS